MKKLYDDMHTEREFKVGDFFYLKLQLYRQSSVALKRNFKLSGWYYDPFKVSERIGKVAYRINLPSSSRLHLDVHVYQLKKNLGDDCAVLPTLLEINSNDTLAPIPQAMIISVVAKENKRF